MTPKSKREQRVDRVYRAISHSGRRALLTLLGGTPGQTLGELAEGQPMTRQAVSQHLQILEDADLVVTRWQGREKLHFLNPVPLSEASATWLEPLITPESDALVALKELLESDRAASAGRRRRSGAS